MKKKESGTTKTGRKPKAVDQVKRIYRNVRLTPEEDKQISAKAAQYGESRSEFMRKAALGAKIVTFPSPETIKLFKDHMMNLRNIGTNLNAIAHRANTEGIKFGFLDLREAREECEELLRVLQEIQARMMQ